jgi:tetrahydromethanopterin S-methyltransferase subunit F
MVSNGEDIKGKMAEEVESGLKAEIVGLVSGFLLSVLFFMLLPRVQWVNRGTMLQPS